MRQRPLFAVDHLRLPRADAEAAEQLPPAALCHRFTLGQSAPAPAKAIWKALP